MNDKDNTTDKSISNNDNNLPHDSLFKSIMENNIAAKEFLDQYLPAEVKEIVNLDTIKGFFAGKDKFSHKLL